MNIAQQARERSQAAKNRLDLEDEKTAQGLVGKILAEIEKACDRGQFQTGFGLQSTSDAVKGKTQAALGELGFKVTSNGNVLHITW